MQNRYLLSICLLLCIVSGSHISAQNNSCGPETVADTSGFAGTAFFNYGSTARSKSNTYRTALAVGQTIVGFTENVQYTTSLGFYARYLLPPFALRVTATQGELLDRIQVSWEIDALGASPGDGFNIYRDGVFLASVASNIRSYNDFNVIAGQPYTYTVTGLNPFGEGAPASALGFQVPNGTVTGWVSTINGTPVPGVSVMLTPMQGFSARFDHGDGALIVADTSGAHPFLPSTGQDWTMTFWMKTESSVNGIVMSLPGLYLRALSSSGGHEGIQISGTENGPPFLTANFADSIKHDWQHITLRYDGLSDKGRLYVNGELADIASMASVSTPDSILIGALAGAGIWNGFLDELRIYHNGLNELDFDFVMHGTASSETPHLMHYWKMDEELGVQSYDIVNRLKLYLCGATFDPDRPPVQIAGITNEDGFYRIESASYGTGTTFLATPSKNFYKYRALSFEKAEQDFVTLPDFAMTPKATIELWVNCAVVEGNQCLLSKEWGLNEFSILVSPAGTDNEIGMIFNGAEHTFGQLGGGYQHIAVTRDSVAGIFRLYKNGVQLGSPLVVSQTNTGNWTDPASPWLLGKNHDDDKYYGGLIAEVAFYDTTLSASAIMDHFENPLDIQEPGLRVYFPMDEGSGNAIGNVGSVLLDNGITTGTEWSALAPHQVVTPHIFTPATRQVTLNPSVTSVDQVDFVDRSTIGVSGYVRYQNTDCFAKNVEILVNGLSFSPQVFTDSTGRFVIDFDPGTTAKLSPKFEDHSFMPQFWQITNLSTPVAGIVFNDNTTRDVEGQVAGGLCKKSITDDETDCIVKVSSFDGCFERQVNINNTDGEFAFEDLPPLERMTIAVIEHSDPLIKSAFETQGGSVIDLSQRDTMIDFIYRAPPQVEIVSGLDTLPGCPMIVMEFEQEAEVEIRMIEEYGDEVCVIDTAAIRIINGIADEVLDTAIGGGQLTYEFKAGVPNPSPPFLKTLQVVGTTLDGQESSTSAQAIVIGSIAKTGTFATILPETPSLILRDPPGDGSYSYLEKNERFCQKLSFQNQVTQGVGGSVVLDFGPDLTIPTFFGVPDVAFQSQVGANISMISSAQRVDENTMEVCSSLSERISTSADDGVVGSEGDVYVGGALNIEFGFVDIVTFDTLNCIGVGDVGTMITPGDYATTFMYSEAYIVNTLIPYLETLAIDTTDTLAQNRLLESIVRWTNIVAANHVQKDSAEFIRNISFDAGTTYEYAETSDTAKAHTTIVTETQTINAELSALVYVLGVGGGYTIVTEYEDVRGRTHDGSGETGITTGYVLDDDDPLDAFTVDIGMDLVYKTPVFNLKSGQSSCPWEEGTANRAGVNLQLAAGSEFEATNVPANEPAIFHLVLGNLSATNEDWTYGFTSIAASNPDGAIIKLNGQPLNYIQEFHIPYGSSQTVTLTVERGPVEYDYDSLLVAQIAVCEWGGNHLTDDTVFFSPLYLSADFIRPCSEVNINVPQQDWVIFPDTTVAGNGDSLRITVSGYNLNEPLFKLVKLQYRLIGGDGAWINIPDAERYNPNWVDIQTLPDTPPFLGSVFTQFYWNTGGLKDGGYEIRAVAECTGDAADAPGFSTYIRGRIDRQPPSLVGLPQPSDGVLHVGDEISFTFNKHVDCNGLNPLTSVRLFNTRTGQQIDANVTCFENKIVLEPVSQNIYFENDILRAELDSISDLTGNILDYTDWEFFVDRNELAWLTDSAGMTKYEDEVKSLVVKIHNRGGYPVPFSLEDIPEWIHVAPDTGVLVPNEIRDLVVTAQDTLEFGWFSDSIKLKTHPGLNPFFMGGTEALPFAVRNICRPPDWAVNPALYQFTMNMVTRIRIGSEISVDPEDQVGVFINGQLRGTAKLIEAPPAGYWLAFITIHGNSGDVGKALTFELFDASECIHYPGEPDPGEIITFSSNGSHGSPTTPKLLVTNGMQLREIDLKTGWNWISFNLGFPNPAINKVLSNIGNPTGDLIKDQTKFAVYNNNTWSGSLAAISNEVMYMYQAAQPRTIKITGQALVPENISIPVVPGWNWISYIPSYKLTVSQALASIIATPGDIIKSQTSFAQYVNSTVGWVGDLKTMQAPNGYQLRLASGGTLMYPAQGSLTGNEILLSRNTESQTAFWNVDASLYEHNSTLIGMFRSDNGTGTTADMELGAFVGDEIRGSAASVYIEYLDAWLFFMTCYANTGGEQFHFKLYDASTGEIQILQEKLVFSPNGHEGTVDDPVPFTLQTTGVAEVQHLQLFDAYPNPFRTETACRFMLPYTQDVLLSICDLRGVQVFTADVSGVAGMNTIVWNGKSTHGLAVGDGVYILRLETEQGSLTRKIVLQR